MSVIKFADIANDVDIFGKPFQLDLGEYGVFDLLHGFDFVYGEQPTEPEEIVDYYFNSLCKQFVPEQRDEAREAIKQMMADDVFVFSQIRLLLDQINSERTAAHELFEKKVKSQAGKASGGTVQRSPSLKPTGRGSSKPSGLPAAKLRAVQPSKKSS